MFGHDSLLFGNRLSTLPVYFQPVLFYPDWFFMAWPYDVFKFCTGPHTQDMANVIAGALFWLILGIMCASFHLSSTFDRVLSNDWLPFNYNIIDNNINKSPLDGMIAVAFGLLNTVYWLVSRVVIVLLYWHIVFARIIGVLLGLGGIFGDRFSTIVEKLVMFIMVVPAVVYVSFTTLIIIFHFS